MPSNTAPPLKHIAVILLITLTTQIQQISSATSIQSSHHHKHRHKHQFLTINSNQIHDIREAFDEYRNTISKDNKRLDFQELTPLRHHHKKQHHTPHRHRYETNQAVHEDETLPAIHQHQHHGRQFMNRQKRLNSGTTTTTTTVKSIDNYDEEYDDEESDGNRRVSDDAHVQQARSSQIETSNQLLNGESLTSYKFKNLGTREGVDRSFQESLKSSYSDPVHRQIFQNVMRTKIDGMCRWPNKKVIDSPQLPMKLFTPRKYVIYRCSDDTSCCGSSDKTCVAKKSEELTYYFSVQYSNQSIGVETLRVQNHTECECIYKNQRRAPPSHAKNAQNSWTSTRRPYTTSTVPPTTSTVMTLLRRAACKCPQTYQVVTSTDGHCECKCDLHDSRAECRLKYEGKEGFTISDQRCIMSRDCTQPHCLYGTYQMAQGRCPDRNDRFNRGSSRHHHNSHHQQQPQRL